MIKAWPPKHIWLRDDSDLSCCWLDKFLLSSGERVDHCTKAFKIVSRKALKNAMYCHLKSYFCTSSGTRILPEVS